MSLFFQLLILLLPSLTHLMLLLQLWCLWSFYSIYIFSLQKHTYSFSLTHSLYLFTYIFIYVYLLSLRTSIISFSISCYIFSLVSFNSKVIIRLRVIITYWTFMTHLMWIYFFLLHRYVKEKSNPAELVMLSGMKDASKTSSYRSESLQNTISVCEKYTGEDQEASQKLMQHKLPDNIPTQDLLHRKVSSSAFSPKAMKDGFWKSTVDILFPRDGQCRKLGDSNRKKTKLFHFGLLRNSAFLGFCLSLGAFIAASKSVFIFLPALAKSGGLTTSEAVLILSFSGAVDTVGRIVSGYLLDRSSLRKRRLVVYCCILFLLAVVCASMPVLGGDFLWLCVTSSLFGMLTGVLASQKSVICVDLLGSERMPSAFGILLLFQALGKGIGPLLFGKDGFLFLFYFTFFYNFPMAWKYNYTIINSILEICRLILNNANRPDILKISIWKKVWSNKCCTDLILKLSDLICFLIMAKPILEEL